MAGVRSQKLPAANLVARLRRASCRCSEQKNACGAPNASMAAPVGDACRTPALRPRMRVENKSATLFIAREGPGRIDALARLRGEADLRIRGAKSTVAVPAFDDLEEETFLKSLRVQLKIFALAFALIKDIVCL